METFSAIDVYGRSVELNWRNRKLHAFNNRKGQVIFNCETVENGEPTGHYTDVAFCGKAVPRYDCLDNTHTIKMVLDTFTGSTIKLIYTIATEQYGIENNDKTYKLFCGYVGLHKKEFFTKTADVRKKIDYKRHIYLSAVYMNSVLGR